MSTNFVLNRVQVDIPFKDPSTYNFFTFSDLELKLGSGPRRKRLLVK